MSGTVRSYVRRSKSGKSVRVRAHARGGGSAKTRQLIRKSGALHGRTPHERGLAAVAMMPKRRAKAARKNPKVMKMDRRLRKARRKGRLV